MFDSCVVGLDGTEEGYEALRQALALIPDTAALHVVVALNRGIAAQAGYSAPHALAELEQEAEEIRDRANELLAGRAAADVSIVEGDATRVLTRVCQERGAALLALGAHSRSRLVGILIGGVSTTLLHDTPCSVLVARARKDGSWRPDRIVVGIDGSADSLAALAAADGLAASHASELTVLVATGGKLKNPEGEWTRRVDAQDPGHPVDALVERSSDANLVVVGARGLHGIRALGSVSERIAHKAHCSVLVLRNGSDAAA